VVILLVSAVPLALAMIMYFLQWGVPAGKTNEGLLLSSSGQWRELEAKVINAIAPPDTTEASWLILMHIDGECNAICGEKLYALRQIHVALGREAYRVQRALAMPFAIITPTMVAKYPNMRMIHIGKPHILKQGTGVYLVDPMGNIMMYYTFSQIGKPILKDLKKLLRYSNIG
jgi:hypothetical protein